MFYVGVCQYLIAFATEIFDLFSMMNKTTENRDSEVVSTSLKKELFHIIKFHAECSRLVNILMNFFRKYVPKLGCTLVRVIKIKITKKYDYMPRENTFPKF